MQIAVATVWVEIVGSIVRRDSECRLPRSVVLVISAMRTGGVWFW
jgi:hypothetical protein